VRTLAAVARTLREIAAITKPQEMLQEMAPLDDAADDPMPRDIDEFRRELTRRVEKIIDAETGAGERPAKPDGLGSKIIRKKS
jgi:hypothetical protein